MVFKGYSKEKVVRHSVGDNSNGTPTVNMMDHLANGDVPVTLLSIENWKELTGQNVHKIVGGDE